MQTEEFIAFLSQNGYGPKRNGNNYVLKINNNTLTIDIKENKYAVERSEERRVGKECM